MLTGTISYCGDVERGSIARGQEVLEGLGVEVLSWNPEHCEFNVRVSDEAMEALGPMWGCWVWCLTPEGT